MLERIWNFCKRSHTIAWAWICVAAGSILEIIAWIEPEWLAPLLSPQAFGIFVLVNGIATKKLREYRDPEMQ